MDAKGRARIAAGTSAVGVNGLVTLRGLIPEGMEPLGFLADVPEKPGAGDIEQAAARCFVVGHERADEGIRRGGQYGWTPAGIPARTGTGRERTQGNRLRYRTSVIGKP